MKSDVWDADVCVYLQQLFENCTWWRKCRETALNDHLRSWSGYRPYNMTLIFFIFESKALEMLKRHSQEMLVFVLKLSHL